MALLEVLRAPLLLSPVSDVAAGWAVATALMPGTSDAALSRSMLPMLAAVVVGICLLGAGMAQNALLDRADDAARKPGRPLPRGAISVSAVAATFALLTLAALAASLLAPGTLPLAIAIVVLTAAYHTVLKPQRLAGCLTLGTLRGLDMALGAAAAAGGLRAVVDLSTVAFSPLAVCAAYALYIAGASLHASTDDAPRHAPSDVPSDSTGDAGVDARRREAFWSRLGLSVDVAVLVALGWVASTAPDAAGPTALVFAFALVRLLHGWRHLPPPPLTGVALSNMYLLGAGVCFGAGRVVAGVVVLLLFVGSRRLMRIFPPS